MKGGGTEVYTRRAAVIRVGIDLLYKEIGEQRMRSSACARFQASGAQPHRCS